MTRKEWISRKVPCAADSVRSALLTWKLWFSAKISLWFFGGKNSQELLSNQWGLSTLSAEVPWNQCRSVATYILISFQHSNYIDYYSPWSTSPGNCRIYTSFFVQWNGLFSNVGPYLELCFIILIPIFWYRYSFISFFPFGQSQC